MGIQIDKVLDLAVDEQVIFDRMSGRRVCEKCGASYHVKSKPSKVEGICDSCGGKLVIRKDDQPRRCATVSRPTRPDRAPDRVLPQPRQAGRGGKRHDRRGYDGRSHEGFGGISFDSDQKRKELEGMRRANALSAAALKYGGEHIEAV